MLGRRNLGWGDVTWDDKAMGRNNLHSFTQLTPQSISIHIWLTKMQAHCGPEVKNSTPVSLKSVQVYNDE